MSISTPKEVHEIRLKRGRPNCSKDVTPQKGRTQMSIGTPEEVHDKFKGCYSSKEKNTNEHRYP